MIKKEDRREIEEMIKYQLDRLKYDDKKEINMFLERQVNSAISRFIEQTNREVVNVINDLQEYIDHKTSITESHPSIKIAINNFNKNAELLIINQKQELTEIANSIFSQGLFMGEALKQLTVMIEEEVRSQIKNSDVHTLIRGLVTQYTDTVSMRDIIKEVVETVLGSVNKSLEKDLEITKMIAFSIDKEIQHTLINLPVSERTEQNIKEIILKKISDFSHTKSIGTKKSLKLK